MSDRTTDCRATRKEIRVLSLRLWCAEMLDPCWRASLEDPRTRERISFVSLELLFAYIVNLVESDGKGGRLE